MRFEHLRRHLIKDHPDIDDETLFDTLEVATNLNEAVGTIIRSAPEEDRRKILDVLKDGAGISGGVLSNSQNTLAVRTQ